MACLILHCNSLEIAPGPAAGVRPPVARCSASAANLKARTLKFDRSIPTIGPRRYHIVVYFPEEKVYEAHFPIHRDQPRRVGAFERRNLRGRASIRSAPAAGRPRRLAGVRGGVR